MGLAQQTRHQAKLLQSRIQSTDANLRRLLAQLHKLDAQMYNLTSERDATFNAINDAEAQLAELELQAHREVQEVRPPTFTPHPHITLLLAKLAASPDPTSTHAVAEFTSDGPNDAPMDVRSDEFYPTVDPYFAATGFAHPPSMPMPYVHVYPTAHAA